MDNKGFDNHELDVVVDAARDLDDFDEKRGTDLNKVKWLFYKNLIVIGFGWIFLFTAFQSISNLQSSLNPDDGLGTISLSAIYVSLILGAIFLPSIIIKRLGVKYTIIASQLTYLLYVAANLYPRHYTLIPAAIVLGLGAANLWTAKCKMLTDMGAHYAELSGQKAEPIVNRYFGIFFAMFQSSNIWGNIISSTILKPEVADNDTFVADLSKCGFNDCPGSASASIKKPQMSTVIKSLSFSLSFKFHN